MRPVLATIDLDALRHNYRHARALGGGKALAVVKADAYGHGATRCAQALEDEADGFGVACIEEALELRAVGIRKPIVLLEGFFDAAELALIEEHDLWTAVATQWQVKALERQQPSRPLQVWLKLDSGMHRLGLSPGEYLDAWQRLRALPFVAGIVAMTHLARADELSQPGTEQQLAVFDTVLNRLPGGTPSSIANSAALIAWPRARREWVRPGLMLYGTHMLDAHRSGLTALRPVMQVESAVIAVRELDPGEPIGYAATFVTERPTRVGVVAMGYADGYPQYASADTPVLVDGRRSRLIGRVSMDMLTVDLTDHPESGVGSKVELWGRQLPVAEIASHCHSSPYRVMAGLKRAPRRFVGGFTA